MWVPDDDGDDDSVCDDGDDDSTQMPNEDQMMPESR